MTSEEQTRIVPPAREEDPATARTLREAGGDEDDAPVMGPRELMDLPLVPKCCYHIVGEIAEGGIGTITEARDVRLDRAVAIKQPRRSSELALQRFAREVHITARLQHPSIVPLHEAGRWPDEGGPFFAMKLVAGGSLEEHITSCVALRDHLRLLQHVIDVAEAMAYAHSQGIIHRDLKPNNVLVGPFGETVVIDWGLAKDIREAGGEPSEGEQDPPSSEDEKDTIRDQYETTAGNVLGTPSYMPPEQAKGRAVDARSDVYSLGAIMYQVLSGRIPYSEYPAGEVLSRVVERPPRPLVELQPELPPDLLAIVDKAMARDPAQRYPDAQEMASELRRYTTGRLVSAYQYSTGELLRRFVRRQRAAVSTAVLAALVLVGLGVWSFLNITDEKNQAEHARRLAEDVADQRQQALRIAEERLNESIMARAESAAEHDPTLALALLKHLKTMTPRAASLAVDAMDRGVAVRVLRGHTDQVAAVAFSPRGDRLASAGSDGAVYLWNTADGSSKHWQHRDRVPAVAISPDGSWLASASYDGDVVLRQIRPGEGERSLVLRGHRRPAKALAFAPKGDVLASVAEDSVMIRTLPDGKPQVTEVPTDRPLFARISPDSRWLLSGSHERSLRLWSLSGGEQRTLAGHEAPVQAAVFFPQGDEIASADEAGSVRIWQLSSGTGKVVLSLPAAVLDLAVSPDGRKLLLGRADGKVVLWERSTGERRIIAEHSERITRVALGPRGRWAASASWDKTVALQDLQTGAEQRLGGHRSVVSTLAFNADGSLLATGSWDHEVRLWTLDARRRRVLRAHAVGVKAVAFDSAGEQIVSGGHDDRVRLWDARTGELKRTFEGHTDHVFRVAFSPDGSWIASTSDDRTARLWRVDGSQSGLVLEGHQADVEELAFSPDSRYLATAGEDSRVGLWEVDSGRGGLLEGPTQPITDVAFGADGTLAAASRDRTIRLYAPATRVTRRVLRGHSGEVASIAFSKDGTQLVSAGRDNRVQVWSVADGATRTLAELPGAALVAISPDDELVAVASSTKDLWLCPFAGDRPCRSLKGHDTRVNALAFNADGSGLATAGGDRTVRLWSVQSGACHTLRGHTAPVFDVAIASGEGALLASASADGTVRLWPWQLPPRLPELRGMLDQLTTLTIGLGSSEDTSP